jgi:hypothetical protein
MPRIMQFVKAGVLLLAAQQGVIELDATDKAFIAGLLSHALKEA